MWRLIAATCVAVGLGLPAAAGAAGADSIVDTAYVEAAIQRGAIVWDVRDAADYRKGHIPGAVNVGEVGKVLREDNSEDYIPHAQLLKVLGDGGIDPAKEVVVYGGRGNPFVYFGQLTLRYLGGDKALVYHGGIDEWRAAGKPVLTEAPKATPVTLSAKPAAGVTVSTSDMLTRVKRGDAQIVDVRTPGEYSGRDIRAIRGGHIPGALNIPYEQNWVDPATPQKLARKEVKDNAGMSLKPRAELEKLYGNLDRDKETVVYCQSGVRAAETAAVLADLGFKNVKVYDSSWLGWGNTLDAPAENVAFFNVGAMQGRIGALQRRIEDLERELAAAKAR
jgi:thiosulfate/3-mercaptopyruvate sulfurtransferase